MWRTIAVVACICIAEIVNAAPQSNSPPSDTVAKSGAAAQSVTKTQQGSTSDVPHQSSEFSLMLHQWEAAISLAAAFIALCALGATLWQSALTRKHNRLSVRPALVVTTHEEEQELADERLVHLIVTLHNNGLGPAIIDSVALLDGEKVTPLRDHHHARERLRESLGDVFLRDESLAVFGGGSPIKASDSVVLMNLWLRPSAASGNDGIGLRTIFERMGLQIKYRCMYGSRGVYDTRDHLTALKRHLRLS